MQKAEIPKVLHCVVKMDRGGYETFIMNVYRKIDRTKIQFDFISSEQGQYDKEIISLGGKIHFVPFITKVGPFVYAKQIEKVLQQNPQYKIVHSHMDKFSGMVLRVANKNKVPVRIAHSHNTKNEGGILYQWVKDYYGNMVLPNATNLMACSQDAAKWMFKEKAKEAWIVPNGIELENFAVNEKERARIRQELKLKDKFVIGNVGRFTAQKNHTFLLKIFKEILLKQKNAVLVLVGDGPLREKIQAQAVELGLNEKVLFLGVRADVPSIMQAMDVFVFPSLFEGLGISLLEAQAAGLPCLASDNIPQEVFATELAQKESFQTAPSEWAKKIETMVRRKVDMTGLEKYNIETVTQELEHYYQNVWAQSNQKG